MSSDTAESHPDPWPAAPPGSQPVRPRRWPGRCGHPYDGYYYYWYRLTRPCQYSLIADPCQDLFCHQTTYPPETPPNDHVHCMWVLLGALDPYSEEELLKTFLWAYHTSGGLLTFPERGRFAMDFMVEQHEEHTAFIKVVEPIMGTAQFATCTDMWQPDWIDEPLPPGWTCERLTDRRGAGAGEWSSPPWLQQAYWP
jgi:hypothetical protein